MAKENVGGRKSVQLSQTSLTKPTTMHTRETRVSLEGFLFERHNLFSMEKRLIQDLEFVQMLGNPEYVVHLMRSGYFNQLAFRNYLKYLLYLRTPEFAHFLLYPLGLEVLKLLTNDAVVDAFLEDIDLRRTILNEQIYSAWALRCETLVDR
jgi:hypothetical protein